MRDCPLTDLELDILRRLAEGLTYQQIARERGRAPSTIRTELHRIYLKTGVADRAQAVIYAYCQGWLELPLVARSREERLLARVAETLEQLVARIEDRPLTAEQRRYLRLFESWLRTDTCPAADTLRHRMVDQLRVVFDEADMDPRRVLHQHQRKAA